MLIAGKDKKRLQKFSGFTLIELMVSIAIAGILVAVAAPSMSSYWKNARLVSATEAVYSQIQLARSVALARNQEVFLTFGNTGTSNWCMAISENSSCDCTTSGFSNCTLTGMPQKVLVAEDYPSVQVTTDFTGDDTSIEMPRGLVSETGTVTLELTSSEAAEVELFVLGRVEICSSDLNQYKGCP